MFFPGRPSLVPGGCNVALSQSGNTGIPPFMGQIMRNQGILWVPMGTPISDSQPVVASLLLWFLSAVTFRVVAGRAAPQNQIRHFCTADRHRKREQGSGLSLTLCGAFSQKRGGEILERGVGSTCLLRPVWNHRFADGAYRYYIYVLVYTVYELKGYEIIRVF